MGEANFYVAPSTTPQARAYWMKWLKQTSRDSDRPRCTWHEHRQGEPCNEGCNEVRDGRLRSIKEEP